MSAIEFLRWDVRYRKPVGYIDTQMTYGVHDSLVRRGIARFVERPLIASAISEPVASATEAPKRRQRRSDTIEE